MKNKYFSFYSLPVFLFLVNTVSAQPVSQTFDASGVYTVPAGFSAIVTIEAWGAGARGGTGNGACGGGGGGAFASTNTTLTAGSYTVTVGTGGTNLAPDGTNSSFSTIVIAEGGFSTTTGAGGPGGTVAGSTGTTRFSGLTGALSTGNRGGNGGTGANGAAGGQGGAANDGVGGDGNAPGGGGGGKGGPGNSTSGGGVGGNGRVMVTVITVLPVQWGNIKAFEKQNGVQIEWTVYTEINLSKYKIERSANGINFGAIGEIAARNVAGEDTYSFFDSHPLKGVNFYRLKSIDIDGKTGISSVIKINPDKSAGDIFVYPNPVRGNFVSYHLSDLVSGKYTVKIFNFAGQEIAGQIVNHTGGAINQKLMLPSGTQPGVYIMQLNTKDAKSINKTFIVGQ